jgi:hypothetical protein
MAATYEPIATTTVAVAAATITFSSIPSTYTDLRLIFIPTVTLSTADARMTFNSDSATNYSSTNLYGNGTAAASLSYTSAAYLLVDRNTLNQTPHLYTIDLFSYAGSTYKTCLVNQSEDDNGSGRAACYVGLWRSTSAVNRIDIATSSSTFAIGTTATLYGIKAA